MGLITINRQQWLSDDSVYEKFSNNEFYLDLKQNNYFEDLRREFQETIDQFGREEVKKANKIDDFKLDEYLKESSIETSKGVITITPLGSAFLKICF